MHYPNIVLGQIQNFVDTFTAKCAAAAAYYTLTVRTIQCIHTVFAAAT